jgi:hypothetical protein
MFFIILGLLICVISMVFIGTYQDYSIWGSCGMIIGGYLILKGRTKLGLKNK